MATVCFPLGLKYTITHTNYSLNSLNHSLLLDAYNTSGGGQGTKHTPEQESKGSQHSPIAAAGVTQQ